MPIRFLMIAVIGFVVACILSVIVVKEFDQQTDSKSTTPPDPLVVTPERAAQDTQ